MIELRDIEARDAALDRAQRHVVAVAGHVARASAARNARAIARALPRLHRAVAVERGARRAVREIEDAYREERTRARAAG